MARFLKLDVGYSAGMLSGALTESPAIGTASEAIRGLAAISEEQKQLLDRAHRGCGCDLLHLRDHRSDSLLRHGWAEDAGHRSPDRSKEGREEAGNSHANRLGVTFRLAAHRVSRLQGSDRCAHRGKDGGSCRKICDGRHGYSLNRIRRGGEISLASGETVIKSRGYPGGAWTDGGAGQGAGPAIS